jgi:hypothetical protein
MADINVRSDSVDVEQIMRQIRMRIREKRGVDYTEDEIRELATVKLERFLDPSKVRSGLLEEFRQRRQGPMALENFEFEDSTIYGSHRAPWLQKLRRLLNPILKLFFNPNPIIRALHLQSKLNRWAIDKEQLDYEVISNLVLEITRLGIEVRNMKMRLESLSARLDFDEHRARALESVVQYRPGDPASGGSVEADADGAEEEPPDGDTAVRASRRRRRRRGRRRTGLSIPPDLAGAGEVGAEARRHDATGNARPASADESSRAPRAEETDRASDAPAVSTPHPPATPEPSDS